MSASEEKLTEKDIGVIRKAMAFRVKYRVCAAGKFKRRTLLASLGVHPCNRGGIYPNEDRVKGLSSTILKWGADMDEADHNGVMVEEIPDAVRDKETVKNLPERYTQYNKRKCLEKPPLSKCFDGTDVLYGNLSHNHLLLVLLSWANGAKWDLDQWCDPNGCLDISAVADPVFQSLVSEGLLMEKLSYKMLIEEPEAACLISNALNKGQEAACKTSELTAVAVLTGAVTLNAEQSTSQQVAYETVKEKLRHELDYYVDEPEFIEMFEFVVSVGANQSTYIKELLEFGDRFVDSKYRSLRLNAFTEVNKMPATCPRSKVAVLKRAYRKKPSYGYCPSPEASWGKIPEADLKDLEDLLQFFHVECQPAVAEAIPGTLVAAYTSNVDVAASEAFLANVKDKARKQKLLEVTAKYYWQVAEKSSSMPKAPLKEKFAWIQFAQQAEKKPAPSTADKTAGAGAPGSALQPKVFKFNEATGELLGGGQSTRVDDKTKAHKKDSSVVKVPWREWHDLDICSALGAAEGDMAAALGILRMLHLAGQAQSVEVLSALEGHSVRVVASATIALGALELPPCVPKASKMCQESSNPRAVPISVVRPKPSVKPQETGGAAKKTDAKQTDVKELLLKADVKEAAVAVKEEDVRSRATYYVHPEWVMPASDPIAADEGDEAPSWKWTEGVTMHPFWTVRRLSREQLDKENAQRAAEAAKNKSATPSPLEFNCELKVRQFSVCNVGLFQTASISNTAFVEVPLLTNSVQIDEGQELLFEAVAKAPTKRKEATWKDDSQRPPKVAAAKAAAKAKAQNKQPAKLTASTMEI